MKESLTSQRWKAFALLVVSYFITIVNVALATIGRELRFPRSSPPTRRACSPWDLSPGLPKIPEPGRAGHH